MPEKKIDSKKKNKKPTQQEIEKIRERGVRDAVNFFSSVSMFDRLGIFVGDACDADSFLQSVVLYSTVLIQKLEEYEKKELVESITKG